MKANARPMVLLTTILASSMVFMDGTVVNVALPALQRAFGATAADVQWVIESYALLLASLLLVGGSAGDRFGRRRVFAIGVVLFAAASVWCGLVGSVQQLIYARAVQGIGGALLVPGSLALITASYPEDSRGRAIGTWSGYSAITAGLGPVVGGALIEHLSWRYVFLINAPLAAAVVFLAYRYVPESRGAQSKGPLDWPGAVLICVALGCLVYALIEAPTKGWNVIVVIAALMGFVGFLVVEARHPSPMLPLGLFRSWNFSGANLLTLFLYAALGGSMFFLPLNLIQVQGYSAIAAGAALLPMILTMSLLSRWSGGLVDRFGSRRPLVIGPVIAACGFALFALPGVGGRYWVSYFAPAVVLGFGMAICVAPLTTTVMNAVDEDMSGLASGINNAVSRVAALLAIALFGVVMTSAFNHSLEAGLRGEQREAVLAQRSKLAAIDVPGARDAIDQAFLGGFRRVMLLSAALAVVSSISAGVMIDRRRS